MTDSQEQEQVTRPEPPARKWASSGKYFSSEETLEAFREEYAAMPIHEKAMENKWLAGGNAVTTLLLIVGHLVIGGIL